MNQYSEKYKGIHPGYVLARELKKRDVSQRAFAETIGEYPQTLNAICKAKRGLPVALALKIEKELGLEEGAFAFLQTFYEIEMEKQKLPKVTPDLSKIRKILFWDTEFDKIDWESKAYAVIRRVYSRGNESEKAEIERFYGQEKVKQAILSDKREKYTMRKPQIK